MRTCGTLSCISMRLGASKVTTAGVGLVMVGEAGISPKYFATFAFAVARSMSPASTSTALFGRSEEHTSELQSLMRISYAVFCLKKKKKTTTKKKSTIQRIKQLKTENTTNTSDV